MDDEGIVKRYQARLGNVLNPGHKYFQALGLNCSWSKQTRGELTRDARQ